MKLTVDFTPNEIAEAVKCFGFSALISTRLDSWFGFDQLSNIEIKHHPNRGVEKVNQVVYGFISESFDHLELYATCLIEMKDGKKVTFQEFDDMDHGYNEERIVSMVNGAHIELQLDEKGMKVLK